MSISLGKRIIAIVIVVATAASLLGVGRVLAREDPLEHADAIYVLGGDWIQRWLEATDLYHEGYAPLIVVSRGTIEPGERELQRRGAHYPNAGELGRDVMVAQLHVPTQAIELMTTDVDNTAQEADAIREIAVSRHWHRIIVITDRATTRRGGFAMRRALGANVDVIMRAPRLDPFPPDGWWRKRANFRTAFYELPKLIAYWCGLRG